MLLSLLFLSTFLISCRESNINTFQGYIEGDYIYLSSSRAGHLETVLTERGERVDSGEQLFQLDNKSEIYSLQKAEQELAAAVAQLRNMETGKRPDEIAIIEAQLKQAEAEAKNVTAQLKRNEKLIIAGGISKQALEDSRTNAISSAAKVDELTSQLKTYNLPERENLIQSQQASVKSAEIAVAQAKWEVSQKQIIAPTAGLIYDILYRQGEWVPAGSPFAELLPTNNIKVRFFVHEPLMAKIHLGDQMQIRVDGLVEPFAAKVSYISPNAEYTPPIIYSNETRSKLVFMVESKPAPNIAASLHPGQPVSVIMP